MKMKNWMRNAGFTLVELIVVIAVLGVLGAGAAVGYSGYTKKAAKSADQQLAAQIKYALEVAQVSDPMPNGAAALVLSKDAAATVSPASGGAATEWVSNAMANAFGDNWKDELKLQYGEWGKGSAISASTLGYFGNVSVEGNEKYDEGIAKVVNGTAVPSFANDVDDLFVMIRDTAIAVNGAMHGDSGAKLVQEAAKFTTGADNATTADDFAKKWKSCGWADITNSGDFEVDNASGVANAGVVKARNVALACYLRKEGVAEDICQAIENFSSVNQKGINIPYDAMAALKLTDLGDGIFDNNQDLSNQYKKTVQGVSDFTETHKNMIAQINRIIGSTTDENGTVVDTEAGSNVRAKVNQYLTKPVSADKKSQAYLDGLTYYTMMSTVNSVNKGAHSANDDTYWDEMAGAVGLYGSIARGEATLAELKAALENAGAEGDVSVAVMAGQKGLTVRFSPLTIAP